MTQFAIPVGPDYPSFTGTEPCHNEDPNLFTPDSETGGPDAERAKAVCRPCPLKQECLDWALLRGESGIWGGTTDPERHEIRKRERLRVVHPGGPSAVRAEIFRLLARGLPEEAIARHVDRPLSNVRSAAYDYRRITSAQKAV